MGGELTGSAGAGIRAQLAPVLTNAGEGNTLDDDHDPRVIQAVANTSVLGLYYRTESREKWR